MECSPHLRARFHARHQTRLTVQLNTIMRNSERTHINPMTTLCPKCHGNKLIKGTDGVYFTNVITCPYCCGQGVFYFRPSKAFTLWI
jgi:DnaJ-class molecular chaperone